MMRVGEGEKVVFFRHDATYLFDCFIDIYMVSGGEGGVFFQKLSIFSFFKNFFYNTTFTTFTTYFIHTSLFVNRIQACF